MVPQLLLALEVQNAYFVLVEVTYYAKEVPSTPIHLSNGRKVIFDSLDGITGYTLTADPGIIAQLDNCIRSRIGGVRRATKEEYEEFSKKKLPVGKLPPKQWREELTPSNVHNLAVAPAEARPTFEPKPVAQPAPATPPAPQQPFKPKTSRRKA